MSDTEKSLLVMTMGVAMAMLVVILRYLVGSSHPHWSTDMLQSALRKQGLNSQGWSELVGQPMGWVRDRVRSYLDVAGCLLRQSVMRTDGRRTGTPVGERRSGADFHSFDLQVTPASRGLARSE